jgi:alkyl hydroperoxide reductase subunit AhpC
MTTDGEISFHGRKNDSWAVFFSHPSDLADVGSPLVVLLDRVDRQRHHLGVALGEIVLERVRCSSSTRTTNCASCSPTPKSVGRNFDEFENVEEFKPYLRFADAPK